MMNFLPKNVELLNIQIPLVVWEGEEQGLNISLPQCKTPIDFFLCFGPLIS
jgi:hypothetical protein